MHDFIEAIVLISNHLYKDSKERSTHEHGIVASFSYMIKNDLLTNAGGLSRKMNVNTLEQELTASLIHEFESTYRLKSDQIFTDLAIKQKVSLHGAFNDCTLTIRNFILLLKVYWLINYRTIKYLNNILRCPSPRFLKYLRNRIHSSLTTDAQILNSNWLPKISFMVYLPVL